jgi:nitrous-oxide reductase
MIPGGDSRKPWGKYLLAMNKITKDRYLPTGPELNQAAQLIDISGDKMKLLLDFPTVGEPHYAQGIPASLVRTTRCAPTTSRPTATRSAARASVTPKVVRKGQPGRHLDDGHPQPLRSRQHRGTSRWVTRSTSTSPTSNRTGTFRTASP